MQKYIYIIGIAILGLISCQKEDLTSTPSVDYGEAVAVKLNFTVDGTEPATEEAQTKAMTKANGSTDNDLPITDINNLWIVQFDGIDDDSEAIVAHYLNGDITEATLLPLGRATAIVAVANTFNPNLVPMPLRMTLSEFKNLHRDIVSNTDGNGAFYGGGVLSTGDDGNTYFILNDSCDVTVSADGEVEDEDENETSTSLSFAFKRNVAKVIINLKNQWDDTQIKSITMNEVATESYFYTNREITAVFPSNSVVTMDYNNSDIEISYNGSQSFVYYVPVNMQGVDSAVTSESDKAFYAPSCATYASILVSENDIANSATEYRIYLGADLITDYNLEANKEYEYTITFNGKGDVDNDYRIREIGVVDYTERESANCYIINPSQDVARVYYIPIEDRINEFWEDYTIAGEKVIYSDTEWEVVPLWCDNTSYDITLDEAVRNGLNAIKVTVPKASTAHSNVIVAVKIDDKIVWSWHLWITDYDPDSRAYNVDANTFTYPVDGGYIERYQDEDISVTGEIWGVGGIYEEMFMMDRNLGSRSSDRLGQGGGRNKDVGTLFYQFGRKDPFPANYGYIISGSTPLIFEIDDQNNTTPGTKNFAYSVENPLIFITSSANWSNEQAAYDFSYLWNDCQCNNPAVNSDGDLIEVKENTGRRKSIFDPSPLGWRLPIRAAWNGFNTTTFTTSTFAVDYQENDRTYRPTETLYIANNRRDGENGDYGSTQSGYIWSASPNPYQKATGARCLQFDSELVDNYSYLPRANAFNVRCVKDNIDYE